MPLPVIPTQENSVLTFVIPLVSGIHLGLRRPRWKQKSRKHETLLPGSRDL